MYPLACLGIDGSLVSVSPVLVSLTQERFVEEDRASVKGGEEHGEVKGVSLVRGTAYSDEPWL